MPPHDHLQVSFPSGSIAKVSSRWYVMQVLPPHALVVKLANVKEGYPFRRDEWPFLEFTWSFVLRKESDESVRLLVRERIAFENQLAQLLAGPVRLISFVMSRKMMRGIKERTEARSASVDGSQSSRR